MSSCCRPASLATAVSEKTPFALAVVFVDE